MPELPEVQTTVDGINRRCKGLLIQSVWTDVAVPSPIKQFQGTFKDLSFYKKSEKAIVGAKIVRAERKAKNILIHLSNGYTILVHMKMTGHMMYGSYSYDKKRNLWPPADTEKNNALRDPYNRFLHVVFSFQNGKQLVLSDVRKFAKVTVIKTSELSESLHLQKIGPEPLHDSFSFIQFKKQLLAKPTGAIKKVLLDPSVIAGIGNIYSDELLWEAGVHPLRLVKAISDSEFKKMYTSMKKVLQKGIDFGGNSTSDYRDIDGKHGEFHHGHNAYRLTGTPCKKKGCKGTIRRIAFNGRGAHFCDTHQT